MKIYVDEDLASGLLLNLLQKTGHDAVVPANAEMIGRSDTVQFTFAIHEPRLFNWVIIPTLKNYTG